MSYYIFFTLICFAIFFIGLLCTIRFFRNICSKKIDSHGIFENKEDNSNYTISKISIFWSIFSGFITLLSFYVGSISFLCIDPPIEFTHLEKVYNSNSISIFCIIPGVKIYYTTNEDIVSQNGILYNESEGIKVSDLDLKNCLDDDNKFTINCQLKLFNLIPFGQTKSKTYQLLYNIKPKTQTFLSPKITNTDVIYIKPNYIDDNYFYDYNILIDNDSGTYLGFNPSKNHNIKFNSDVQKIRFIYIDNVSYLFRIEIVINDNSYPCYPVYNSQELNSLIQIDLNDFVYIQNIQIYFYPAKDAPYCTLSDIWFSEDNIINGNYI